MRKILTILSLTFLCLNLGISQNIGKLKTDLEQEKIKSEQLESQLKSLQDSIDNSTRFLNKLGKLSNGINNDFNGDKGERVQLGISFAYGELSNADKEKYRLPTISPMDSTLQYQSLVGRFVLLSTSITISPFLYSDWLDVAKDNIDLGVNLYRSSSDSTAAPIKYRRMKKSGLWLLENSGFSININFLQISTGNGSPTFDQIIEGGIGYSMRLNKNIYWSISRDLKFQSALNDFFVEGEPIMYNGGKVSSISEIQRSDQNYFHNNILLHWSFRFIVTF